MKIENREYKLSDFIKIPFKISPVLVSLLTIHRIVNGLVPSLQVLATAGFIDTAIKITVGQAMRWQLTIWLLWIILLIAYQYISFSIINLARAKLEIKLTQVFRTAVTEKRALLQYRYVENNDTWDLINRIGSDPTGKMDNGLNILLRMADRIIRVISLLLILVAQVWWVAPVILGFTIPLFWLAIKSGKENYEASKNAAKHIRRAQYLQGLLTERDNAEERTLFSYTSKLNIKWYEKFLTAYKINFKAERNRHIKMKTASLITLLISILITGVLLAPLHSGLISTGMFMGIVTASFELVQMMSWELTFITSELANNREYLKDLTAFSSLAETTGAIALPLAGINEPQCIEFRGVSFSYPDTGNMILNNLNLKLFAKKHYAFVGINGAGKTTITKLLTGMYDNYTGDILIDGKNLRAFTQSEIKSLFSIVYQDFAKYQIRMADSIGIGNVNGVAYPQIMDTVRTLGLEEAVSILPEGLDTPLGKTKGNGVDLSGGEWQRVAIARSLVSHAPVHILDEPTAALDPVAESEIYKLFVKISKGKSTVFITHRLGAARLADEIVVISGGHSAEQGSHDELMKLNGIYSKMFEAQRGWYL